MKEFVIGDRQEGQRLDKYLGKLLDRAPKSFLYKMLRKKNIVLNGKKAAGNEILKKEDVIRVYFKDETFDAFSSGQTALAAKIHAGADDKNIFHEKEPDVLYEDRDLLILNKPAGMLSQKAKETDDSVNEWAIRYLLSTGELKEAELRDFSPSIGNRLDRNTSGIITVGKTVRGLQLLGEWFRDHSAKKYYLSVVKGEIREGGTLDGYLEKDGRKNRVAVSQNTGEQKSRIELTYQPLEVFSEYTLLEILLKTGKPHQIRAQLSAIGHPILGDPKYGDLTLNRVWKKRTGLARQLLHACRLEKPDGETVAEAPLPKDFSAVLNELGRK